MIFFCSGGFLKIKQENPWRSRPPFSAAISKSSRPIFFGHFFLFSSKLKLKILAAAATAEALAAEPISRRAGAPTAAALTKVSNKSGKKRKMSNGT